MRQEQAGAHIPGLAEGASRRGFQNHPVLSVNYAGTLLQNGQFDGVESRLRDVEQWLAAPEGVRRPPVVMWMKRNFIVCPAWSPCTVPQWPWLKAMWQSHETRPKVLELARRMTISPVEPHRRC